MISWKQVPVTAHVEMLRLWCPLRQSPSLRRRRSQRTSKSIVGRVDRRRRPVTPITAANAGRLSAKTPLPETCCCTGKILDSSSSSSVDSEPKESALSQHLDLKTGRPPVRSIIRRVLEQADGESAVVACGPGGLQDDVRRSVVSLSDERAVHKGTGAQGIYLHVEGFAIG